MGSLCRLLGLFSLVIFGKAYPYGASYNSNPCLKSSTKDEFHLVNAIRDTLIDNEIIDDVLDDFEPSYSIELSYPDAHENVQLGNDIPVSAVHSRPVFTFHQIGLAEEPSPHDVVFTLILTDPDALSRDDPSKSEMCHWILTNLTTPLQNIHGSDSFPTQPEVFVQDSTVEHAQNQLHPQHDSNVYDSGYFTATKGPKKKKEGELKSYFPPAPPPKTGPHRYVFVLLEGSAAPEPPKKRPHWGYGKVRHGVRDWAEENDLKVVGANFFFAQNKKQ